MKSKKENNQSFQISLEILKNGCKAEQDLLYLFSAYIASNPDFKYNLTYLTDSIDSFFQDQISFNDKQNVFYKVIDYIKEETLGKYKIEVIFDSVFKFNLYESTDLEILSENNSTFHFNRMGDKSFIMKLSLLEPTEIDYLYEIKRYSTDEEWQNKVDSFIKIISK
jgi:hypothetical protein